MHGWIQPFNPDNSGKKRRTDHAHEEDSSEGIPKFRFRISVAFSGDNPLNDSRSRPFEHRENKLKTNRREA